MTDAQVSQVAVEVLRINLAPDLQVSQLAVEVLRPNVGKGIAATAGSFTLSGQSSVGRYARAVKGGAGAFTLSGQTAGYVRTRRLVSAVGAFALTGQDANLRRPGKIFCEVGAFTLTGQGATLGRHITIISAAGSFTLTGQSAGSVRYRKIRGVAGAFALTGNAINIYRAVNVVDPVSGLTMFHRLRPNVPAYADADAAYNAWAASLGVDSSGTDYTVTSSPAGIDFVSLDQPVLDGSLYSGLNLPHSGAVGLYMSPPVTTTATSIAYTWGLYSLGYLMLPTDKPAFALRVFNNNAMTAQFQNTNLKLRKAYDPVTGVYEVIVIMTSSATSSPQQPIRCAYRLRNGYIECVFTVDPTNVPTGGYIYANYIVTNETSDIPFSGDNILTSTVGGTFGVISDDYSYLRPFMTDLFAAVDVGQTTKITKPTLADRVAYRDPIVANLGLTVSSAISATDTTAYGFRPSAVISEILNLAESRSASWSFRVIQMERAAFIDALSAAIPVTIADSAVLSDLADVVRSVIVAEQLGLLDTPVGSGSYATQLVDLILANDDLRRFLGGDLSDTLTVVDGTAYSPILGKVLTDTVGVADTLTQKLIIRVTADDTFNLDDSTPAHWIFRPVLTDSVEISIGYIEPNGSFTTWAINTRTGAVTEYQNFAFNSFAQNGHKYLGAADSGLYELDGTDDDGTDVIAHIKSGYAQLGGSKYSSFKAAYLGMRGDGNIILKLDTGDGKSYTYQTVIQDMQSTKVRLGKGLRARYFSFELISTGPDFDLDTIEFIPLVAQRRV